MDPKKSAILSIPQVLVVHEPPRLETLARPRAPRALNVPEIDTSTLVQTPRHDVVPGGDAEPTPRVSSQRTVSPRPPAISSRPEYRTVAAWSFTSDPQQGESAAPAEAVESTPLKLPATGGLASLLSASRNPREYAQRMLADPPSTAEFAPRYERPVEQPPPTVPTVPPTRPPPSPQYHLAPTPDPDQYLSADETTLSHRGTPRGVSFATIIARATSPQPTLPPSRQEVGRASMSISTIAHSTGVGAPRSSAPGAATLFGISGNALPVPGPRTQPVQRPISQPRQKDSAVVNPKPWRANMASPSAAPAKPVSTAPPSTTATTVDSGTAAVSTVTIVSSATPAAIALTSSDGTIAKASAQTAAPVRPASVLARTAPVLDLSAQSLALAGSASATNSATSLLAPASPTHEAVAALSYRSSVGLNSPRRVNALTHDKIIDSYDSFIRSTQVVVEQAKEVATAAPVVTKEPVKPQAATGAKKKGKVLKRKKKKPATNSTTTPTASTVIASSTSLTAVSGTKSVTASSVISTLSNTPLAATTPQPSITLPPPVQVIPPGLQKKKVKTGKKKKKTVGKKKSATAASKKP
eukprot:TRINITY_DN4236_c0_g1_i1.p1 TRINITY_DN4236_c0_g1~~TRINITY_DN4236_c0_g1_i1.p1  ORF type:complete len:599 (-),score=139.38 TRINITY_DN4236_c0_g1_i1:985-2733(-)